MEERKGFGTTFGFLMAAVGSAVGLGNIWGFPNKMGANGGFTFLVIYLILAALCGFIVMVGELALGRKTGRGVISTYKILTKRFKWLGWLGIIAPFLILSFYCALGGYCIKYVTVNLGNLFNAGFGTGGLGGAEGFGGLLTNQGESVIYGLIFVLITLIIVMCGVSNGIEKVCSVGMPALFILLVICIIRACTLGGNDFTVAVLQADGSTVQQVIHSSALDGLKYMFQPGYVTSTGYYEPAKALVDGAMVGAVAGVPVVKHVTEIPNFISILATAGGQMFFSLSLGMGAMITYGSYLNQKEDLVKNSAIIVFADTLVATMAGIAVIPAAVANGIASGTPLDQIKLGGPNLLFVTLQDVFRAMGTVGALFGVIFYLLVLIAAISSAIALIEVDITYFLDRAEQKGRKGNRPKVAFLVCLAIFAVSVLVGIDGLGTTGVFPWPATAGWNDSMLDFVDMLSEGLAMPIGALMMSIMVGWEIRPQTVLDELHIGYTGRIDTFYRICIKYITPIGMLLVLAGQVNEFFSLNWF